MVCQVTWLCHLNTEHSHCLVLRWIRCSVFRCFQYINCFQVVLCTSSLFESCLYYVPAFFTDQLHGWPDDPSRRDKGRQEDQRFGQKEQIDPRKSDRCRRRFKRRQWLVVERHRNPMRFQKLSSQIFHRYSQRFLIFFTTNSAEATSILTIAISPYTRRYS